MGRALAGSIEARRPLLIDTLEVERPRGLGFGAASISSASQWMRDYFSLFPAIATFSRRDAEKTELELKNGR